MKFRIIIGLLSVLGVLIFIIGTIVGKTFYPDNQYVKWLWWVLWFGFMPLALIFSYKILAKSKRK